MQVFSDYSFSYCSLVRAFPWDLSFSLRFLLFFCPTPSFMELLSLVRKDANHGMVELVSTMFNKLSGQPESYEKKYSVPSPLAPLKTLLTSSRALYRFGRTLGAGTYGIVREAESSGGKVAIKIILKKNVRGNERMVYDELEMLQALDHPNIVHFVDWFESKDKFYIVTQLATGGELFDRICEYGKFTEKDASQTIRQVLGAVNYLHERNIVHRGQSFSQLFPVGEQRTNAPRV
jgi:calcium/calmodulin-dependent protein kinase I